ncbi:hypothetical protein JNK13_04685 [bacterium]|nr:hypothetical protein [bacterium]
MKNKPRHVATVVADAVGLTHFIVANACVVLGQLTDVFKEVGGHYPGLQFVYQYIDYPVYAFFHDVLQINFSGKTSVTFLMGEFVIAISTILYGLIAYFVVKVSESITKP